MTDNFFFPELASRILQVGPAGSKFLGPVMIEVPHVASLRRGEREISILRCEDILQANWTEHRQDPNAERALKVFNAAKIRFYCR